MVESKTSPWTLNKQKYGEKLGILMFSAVERIIHGKTTVQSSSGVVFFWPCKLQKNPIFELGCIFWVVPLPSNRGK